MKLNHLLCLVISLGLLSCIQQSEASKTTNRNLSKLEQKKEADFKFWVWTGASKERSDSAYTAEYKKYSENGIDAVLINTNTDPGLLARLTPLAKQEGLEVHAWIMAMNRPGDSIALQHPDWYAVSREGNSTFDNRPYVDYYQWLCPTREESRNHVLGLVEELSKVEDIESVHLDYIRLPDIFLPVGLLPKYDLKQEEELAEFDFCYCEVCLSEFEKMHHKDPRKMENPALDIEWKQFRLNRIKDVVDDAYEIVHKNGKQLTAAVFPYPEMADHMVRQRWDKWKIDQVLPMIYHNFYNEELDWIGFATRQGVEDLSAKETKLHTGVFVPAMNGDQLKEAILQAKNNGAKGVSFFDGGALKPEHLEVIKAVN
ncbi:hypothetical protein GCM10023115_34380 [Pontixanthobacter gangjinensis]|uniref:Family 10 glycosylhydrolase n=1 Tax=Christiangramia aestuarii TaxID=1028746 RepID=A0A7K1LRH9_9FLAO|nr:family 10 glycosylhydrolase [Christiangramia aestuarii]MUP43393.1 family 10 glycosylhydrolase [Christiangramia aestuarii]